MADSETIMQGAVTAAAVFSQYDQTETDRIVEAVYRAAFAARVRMAKYAQEETGIGRWQDKVLKNVIATQLVYEDLLDLKTVGIVQKDAEAGIIEIAQPVGPILAMIPATSPTATVFFAALSALKTRNPLIICQPRRAEGSSAEAARLCYEAALAAGAPEDCIQWLEASSPDATAALMAHPKLALILAAGPTSLVEAAQRSGTPVLGVGSGNVPVYVDASADPAFAAHEICVSKGFDYGAFCASEQAVVADKTIAEDLIAAFQQQGAYFLSCRETQQLEATLLDATGQLRAESVGRPAAELAQQAGIEAPADTTLLIATLEGVGDGYPLSRELLAPILAFYVADSFADGVETCIDLNFYGGIGHTVSLFCNDEARIREFSLLMNAGRIVVNMPAALGAIGRLYNRIHPSLTLGCGAGGKNLTTDNITARHLFNLQRITRRRENLQFQGFDKSLYFDETLTASDIEARYQRNR